MQNGFIYVGIGPWEEVTDINQILRVAFKLTPGGRIEDGDIEFTEIALAEFNPDKRAADENGKVIDTGALAPVLTKAVGEWAKARTEWFLANARAAQSKQR